MKKDLDLAEHAIQCIVGNDDPLGPFARIMLYAGIAYAKGDVQAAEVAIRLFLDRPKLEQEIEELGIKENSYWRHNKSRETYKVIGVGFLEEFHEIRVAYKPVSYRGSLLFRRPEIFKIKFTEIREL